MMQRQLAKKLLPMRRLRVENAQFFQWNLLKFVSVGEHSSNSLTTSSERWESTLAYCRRDDVAAAYMLYGHLKTIAHKTLRCSRAWKPQVHHELFSFRLASYVRRPSHANLPAILRDERCQKFCEFFWRMSGRSSAT